MLDIDTLNALNDLSASGLYDLEVNRLNARLTREEQTVYVERARKGDLEARQALIHHCIRYALIKAHALYSERRPRHVDVLDLAQEANLEMLESFDKAMEAHDPVAYLLTVARQAIRVYCTYHAPMIQKPEYSMVELAKADPYPATVESLDAPIRHSDGQRLKVEVIEAPALHIEPDDEQRQSWRFAPLYEAVKKRLTPQQRATVIRRYGLFGQPAETPIEIAESSHLKNTTVWNTDFHARVRLAQALEGELHQILRPKPAPEED